ncbi:MAG: acyl-CoA thioesterase [Pseudohongiellaceae bacterium]
MTSNSTPLSVETSFYVRYAETDAMGVVHHANYLVYFEEGRSQYMRDIGSDYAQIEASGYQLPVTETGIRYTASLHYGERVVIRTMLEENRSRRLTFAYEVLNAASDSVLVKGFTRHIWTDTTGKVTRMPSQWKQLFDAL